MPDSGDAISVIDAQTLKFVYANGVPMFHTNGNGITFFGEKGKLYVNRGRFETTPEALGEMRIPENGAHLYKSSDHFRDWLECIRTRKKPICDVEIGARTVTVCHLANIAYLNDAHLKWDPAREQFIHGAGKAEWLDRPHRAPWNV